MTSLLDPPLVVAHLLLPTLPAPRRTMVPVTLVAEPQVVLVRVVLELALELALRAVLVLVLALPAVLVLAMVLLPTLVPAPARPLPRLPHPPLPRLQSRTTHLHVRNAAADVQPPLLPRNLSLLEVPVPIAAVVLVPNGRLPFSKGLNLWAFHFLSPFLKLNRMWYTRGGLIFIPSHRAFDAQW